MASSCARQAERPPGRASYLFGARAGVQRGLLTIRGGGNRHQTWHRCRRREWGPPPGASPPMRMTASWSGSKRTYRIQVCGAKMRPNGELPSDHYADRRRKTPELRRKAHLTVHPPSACSGVKALRNTSDAKAARRQAPLAFRSLDPFRALREPDRRRRDEERPFPLRTKNCEQNPKTIA